MLRSILQRIRQRILPSVGATGQDAHGAARNRRAMITGSVATVARVVQISTSLITVPLTLKYLGNERFGLWMTISSVLAMAQFADFGVGNGVLNAVAKAFGKDDLAGIRRAVSSGFFLMTSIAVFLLGSFYATFGFVNWGNFFRVASAQARMEAGPALAVFATCFCLNISMDVVQRVQLGLQQGYRYGLWQLCGSLLGLTGVLVGVWMKVSLPVLVTAIAGAPIIATAANAVHFFGFVRPELRPTWHMVTRETSVQIARLGGMFFILQMVVGIAYSADNFILARSLGAVNVPEYSIPQRLFALITMMSSMLVSPLWPAYGEAISRGHLKWVRHTLRKSLLLVFAGSSIAALGILLSAHWILHIWVQGRVHPPLFLLLGMAVWTVIACCGEALSMFLNGASIIRFQVIVSVVFAVICVPVKFLLIRRYGVIGIPWATISTYLLFGALPLVVYIPRLLRRMESAHQDIPTVDAVVP